MNIMQNNEVPLTITGAGVIGQYCALALIEKGMQARQIRLIDKRSSSAHAADERKIAVSAGSYQLLARMGATPDIQDAYAIKQIHISRHTYFGRTLLNCEDYPLPALGYVISYRDILRPLTNRLRQLGVEVSYHCEVLAHHYEQNVLHLHTNLHEHYTTDLWIHAEGQTNAANSATTYRDYQQTAVIANVTVSAPINHCAFERFTKTGPLALLPISHQEYSLVWCVPQARAIVLKECSDEEFLAQLSLAFGQRLGRFLSSSARQIVPLKANLNTQQSPLQIYLGNAAQQLHPVAGQGLNLGLRDAYIFAQLYSENCDAPDKQTLLNQFMAARKSDRSNMLTLTDTLARLFTEDWLPQSFAGISLFALDILPKLSRLLANKMMFGWR